MKLDGNGFLREANIEELYRYYISSHADEIMTISEYLQKCEERGVKIVNVGVNKSKENTALEGVVWKR